MKVSARLDGGAALRQMLHDLPSAVGWQQQRLALKDGAEPIRAEAATLCPRDDAAGAHMADHIVIHALTEAQTDRDAEVTGNEAVVRIGPMKGFFYGYFLEYGTSHQGARPFMRPAFDNNLRQSLQVTGNRLWLFLQQQLKAGRGAP